MSETPNLLIDSNVGNDWKPLRDQLEESTNVLLDPDAYPGELLAAAQRMYDLFSKLTHVDDHSTNPADDIETLLQDGKAISPKDAARCLLDFDRTTKFLRGIEAGIKEARNRFPNQRIEVLYAGCGPYAALIIPLCTRFTSEEVRFTLIDIHQRSISSARTLVERLGFSKFIRAYVNCDATEYQHPADADLHVCISETMQRGLAKEPQLAITANLAPQLSKGGIFIPECISIDFCLGDLGAEFHFLSEETDSPNEQPENFRERIARKQLLDLSADTITTLMKSAQIDDSSEAYILPVTLVQTPPLAKQRKYTAMILTKIRVFNSIIINDYDSGLTYPNILNDLGKLNGGETIEFQYHLGDCPGFKYRII